MSRMSSLVLDLQEAISDGVPYETIARNFDVPIRWVFDAAALMDPMDDVDELARLIADVSGD